MALINIPDETDGTSADAADLNSRFAIITGLVNGNIDNANIKAGGVATSNLATNSVTASKIPDASITPEKISDLDWFKYISAYSYSTSIQGTWSPDPMNYTNGNPALYRLSNGLGSAINDEVSYKAVLQAGTYAVGIYHDKDINRGVVTLLIDGATVGSTIDTYSNPRQSALYTEFTTNYVLSTSKLVTINLRMTSKNASSSGFILGLYGIQFRRTV